MALQTPRRSIVGPPPRSQAPQQELRNPDEEIKGYAGDADDQQEHSSENARMMKRIVQMQYLE